ncbi:DUF6993 domain-containing protein [Sinomonas terrae]|uniref:DUF6993 domain-containing protein n=1 Tax=Sinomonas terrae TaxID=2908838 RepID=A0ABS9U6C3_9MICC|nr:hypothetical protein [Sinomonas terrae]MCH6471820.1 hypothetical protein [Sinomonas terrae]
MKNFVWGGLVVVLLAVGGYGLTGALQGLDLSPAPKASAPASSVPSPSPTPSASAPPAAALARFDPSATGAANLDLFKRTLEKAAQSTAASSVEAKTLTTALTGVGFNAAAMQQSADQTSANLQAPTLVVSVRLGAQCLVGQFVRSDASISTEIAAPIQTGACLIGRQSPAS